MFALFAQMNRPAAGNNFGNGANGAAAADVDEGMMAAVLAGTCFFLLVALVVVIFFLFSMMKTLKKCRPSNRDMQPGMVWLNLVPCVNIVWQFMTVIQVASSLKKEFRSRGLDAGGSYGRTLGLTAVIVNMALNMVARALDAVIDQTEDVPALLVIVVFLVFAQLAVIGLFIAYWVRIVGYSRRLDADGPFDRSRRARYDDRYGDDDNYGDDERHRRDDPPPTPRDGGWFDDRRDDPDDRPWRGR